MTFDYCYASVKQRELAESSFGIKKNQEKVQTKTHWCKNDITEELTNVLEDLNIFFKKKFASLVQKWAGRFKH